MIFRGRAASPFISSAGRLAGRSFRFLPSFPWMSLFDCDNAANDGTRLQPWLNLRVESYSSPGRLHALRARCLAKVAWGGKEKGAPYYGRFTLV